MSEQMFEVNIPAASGRLTDPGEVVKMTAAEVAAYNYGNGPLPDRYRRNLQPAPGQNVIVANPETDAKIAFPMPDSKPYNPNGVFLCTINEALIVLNSLNVSHVMRTNPDILNPDFLMLADGSEKLGGQLLPGMDGKRVFIISWWTRNGETIEMFAGMLHHRMRELSRTGNALDFDPKLWRFTGATVWA